jgi:hypothetical protein
VSDQQPLNRDCARQAAGPLTPEQASRWAGLIAAGDDEFPHDLPPADRDRLAGEVRGLLKERLLDLISTAIARDLMRRSRSRDTEVSS